MTEDDFMEHLDSYIHTLRLFWKSKSRKDKALKSMRDLIDNYFED